LDEPLDAADADASEASFAATGCDCADNASATSHLKSVSRK